MGRPRQCPEYCWIRSGVRSWLQLKAGGSSRKQRCVGCSGRQRPRGLFGGGVGFTFRNITAEELIAENLGAAALEKAQSQAKEQEANHESQSTTD